MTDKEQREEVQREIRATRDAIRDEKKDRLSRSFDLRWKWYFISIFTPLGNSVQWQGNCLSANDALESAKLWAENEGIEVQSLVLDEIVQIPKSGPITRRVVG